MSDTGIEAEIYSAIAHALAGTNAEVGDIDTATESITAIFQSENKRLREALEETVFVTADVSDMLRKYDGFDEWSTPVVNIDRLWGIAKQALGEQQKVHNTTLQGDSE